MRTFINLKNWTWSVGRYQIDKAESDEILPVLEKNQPLPMTEKDERRFCKDCGGEVDVIDKFCRWCGRRFA